MSRHPEGPTALRDAELPLLSPGTALAILSVVEAVCVGRPPVPGAAGGYGGELHGPVPRGADVPCGEDRLNSVEGGDIFPPAQCAAMPSGAPVSKLLPVPPGFICPLLNSFRNSTLQRGTLWGHGHGPKSHT